MKKTPSEIQHTTDKDTTELPTETLIYQTSSLTPNTQHPETSTTTQYNQPSTTTTNTHNNITHLCLDDDVIVNGPESSSGTVVEGDGEEFNFLTFPHGVSPDIVFQHMTDSIKLTAKISDRFIKNVFTQKRLKKFGFTESYDECIDMIMLFLSLLVNYYDTDNDKPAYKYLNANWMNTEIFGKHYTSIIRLLMSEDLSKHGAVVTCDGKWRKGRGKKKANAKNLGYALTEHFGGYKYRKYTLCTEKYQRIHRTMQCESLQKGMEHVIASNLIDMYCSGRVALPDVETIHNEAVRLHKTFNKTTGEKYRGKYCVYLEISNRSRSYYSTDEYRILDDNIDLFNLLTEQGTKYLIPIIGKSHCPRVYDSVSMMPAWIRKLIMIDGKLCKSSDYSAVHIHIAMKHYNTNGEYDKIKDGEDLHQLIADIAGLGREDAKKLDLTTLNTYLDAMTVEIKSHWSEERKQRQENMRAVITAYMELFEHSFLGLIDDKEELRNNSYTSQVMFKGEVELMTKVIQILNNDYDCSVLYVYDALVCSEDDYELVVSVMNEVAKESGLKTFAD